MWRLSSDLTTDWATVDTNLKALADSDVVTTRRLAFAAFTNLTQMTNTNEQNSEFTHLMEEGPQLALRK
jgi:hypothetical protein